MLAIIFMSYVEKFLRKVIPSILRTLVVPVLTILITAPVTLWVLGPIGGKLHPALVGMHPAQTEAEADDRIDHRVPDLARDGAAVIP